MIDFFLVLLLISCDRYFFCLKFDLMCAKQYSIMKPIFLFFFLFFLMYISNIRTQIEEKNWIKLFNLIYQIFAATTTKKTLSPTTVCFFFVFVCVSDLFSPYILFLCVFLSFVITFFFLFFFLSCCYWLIFRFFIHQSIRKKETHKKIWRFLTKNTMTIITTFIG